MRVRRLDWTRHRYRLDTPVEARAGAWDERLGVLVRLEDDRGRTGWGEASPLPGYSDDLVADVERDLAHAAGTLLAWSCDACLPAPPQVREILRRLAPASPAARFALETALLDLAGQAAGVPSACLLRGAFPARAVALNALLPLRPAARLRDALAAARARGFTTFKVKLGRTDRWDEERAALGDLAGALSRNERLRADVNGAWTPDEARARLAELAPLGLEYVEQPVGAGELLDFGPAPFPLAADESLRLDGAIARLAASNSAQVVVLKPMVLGGALRCLELAHAARAAGMDVVVTGLFDGTVARAATAALALALDPPPRACGLGGGAARIVPGEAPGLGAGAWPALADRPPALTLAAAAAAAPDDVAVLGPGLRRTWRELLERAGTPAAGDTRPAGLKWVDAAAPCVEELLADVSAGRALALLPPGAGALEAARCRAAAAVERCVAPPARLEDDARALAVIFTSGTTGFPKGVELSRRAFVHAATASGLNLGWHAGDRWLLALPVARVGGLSVLVRVLLARATIVLPASPRVDDVRAALAAHDVTLVSLVPAQLARLLEDAAWRPPPSLRAVLLGGAAAAPSLVDDARARGVPVVTTYGMTEACSQVATERPGDPRGGLRLLPGVEARLVGERLALRGPQLFTRYLLADGPVAPFDDEGWFLTQDRAALSADGGGLAVFGRADEVIISGGLNVDPAALEEFLLRCPGVRAALVFGVPDPTWGALVAAAVVPAPDAGPDLARRIDAVMKGEWHARRPRLLAFVDAIPLTPAGKPDRRRAAALLRDRLHPFGAPDGRE